MSLEVPYPDLNFVPLDILSASEMNQIVANYMYIANQIFDKIYPIGSIYMSATMSTPQEVAAAFGGTWVAWGEGKVPVGVDTSDSDFNVPEKTGGEKSHTLTVNEMPSHNHTLRTSKGANANNTANDKVTSAAHDAQYNNNGHQETVVNNTGDGQAHNNLQPYITCYMFKRTA